MISGRILTLSVQAGGQWWCCPCKSAEETVKFQLFQFERVLLEVWSCIYREVQVRILGNVLVYLVDQLYVYICW